MLMFDAPLADIVKLTTIGTLFPLVVVLATFYGKLNDLQSLGVSVIVVQLLLAAKTLLVAVVSENATAVIGQFEMLVSKAKLLTVIVATTEFELGFFLIQYSFALAVTPKVVASSGDINEFEF